MSESRVEELEKKLNDAHAARTALEERVRELEIRLGDTRFSGESSGEHKFTTVPWVQAEESCRFIRGVVPSNPQVAIVCGSGLGVLIDLISSPVFIDFADIPFFTNTSVPGHKGRLVFGELNGIQVVIMQGRLHFYEGHGMGVVTHPIRVLSLLGVETLVLTNAAGGINPAFKAGDVMMIKDHISFNNIVGLSPMVGPNEEARGPRFFELGSAYSARLRRLVRVCASELGLNIQEGVFAFAGGPQFETPSEIHALHLLGASALSMSTIPEVVVARHCGMRVVAFSTISNVCPHEVSDDETIYLPTSAEDVDIHKEVLATVEREAIPKVKAILLRMFEKMASDPQWKKEGSL